MIRPPSADRGISSLQGPRCKTDSAKGTKGMEYTPRLIKGRKKTELTTYKILAVSGPGVMCSALHLVCSCWKPRVAMVSSCAERPSAGHGSSLPGIKHVPQKSLAWSAPGALPCVPCDLITALIDGQSSHLQSAQSFSKRLL